MVRLIPNLQDGEIQLRLATRLPFWRHRTLMFALSIAICLHVIALALFRIPNVIPGSGEPTIAPIQAIGDANSDPETSIIARLTADRRMRFQAPPRRGPPPLPNVVASFPATLSQRIIPDLEWESLPNQLGEKRLQWLLSGPLAEEHVLTEFPSSIDQPLIQEQRLRFALQIDQRSGKVLWIQSIEVSDQRDVTAKVEDVIRHLQFQTHATGGINHGEIELLIHEGES